jgi:hypothetical protein
MEVDLLAYYDPFCNSMGMRDPILPGDFCACLACQEGELVGLLTGLATWTLKLDRFRRRSS